MDRDTHGTSITVERNVAYEKGKARRAENERDPSNTGSPRDDGYETMTQEEKEDYKRGYRGD